MARRAVLPLALIGLRIGIVTANSNDAPLKTIAGVPIYTHEVDEIVPLSDGKKSYLMFAKPDFSNDQVHSICKDATACLNEGHPDQGGIPFFSIEATEEEMQALVQKHADELEFVEEGVTHWYSPLANESDAEEYLLESPTDRWGLDRVDARSGYDKTFEPYGDGSGAHIYMIDSGIRYSHQEFGGRAIPGADMQRGGKARPCNGQTTCANDVFGHGSHCAGTAAGSKSGVAKNAKIYSVRLSDGGPFGSAEVVGAIDWSLTDANSNNRKPAVMSLSIGGPAPAPSEMSAVNKAIDGGISVVVAAGNCRRGCISACGVSPANVPNAITVGASDKSDQRARFSYYGSCIDIMAPGAGILSASHRSDTQSREMSGTSMACPHVSGAVALMIGANPSMSPKQVAEKLVSDASPMSMGNDMGSPQKLLYVGKEVAPTPPPTPPPTPAPRPPDGPRRRSSTRRRSARRRSSRRRSSRRRSSRRRSSRRRSSRRRSSRRRKS